MRGLPKSPKQHEAVWVVINRLTKVIWFIPVKMSYHMDRLTKLYFDEVVRLHGVPVSIVSDRDSRFTSKFWKSLQLAMGTKLNFSTVFHLQIDGQLERTNIILEDLLRTCVMYFGGSWEDYLSLVESAYNNSYRPTTGMEPY